MGKKKEAAGKTGAVVMGTSGEKRNLVGRQPGAGSNGWVSNQGIRERKRDSLKPGKGHKCFPYRRELEPTRKVRKSVSIQPPKKSRK